MDIFVDFDNIIFNTPKFKRVLVDAFKKSGVSARDFARTYERAKDDGCYSPRRHARLLVHEGYLRNEKQAQENVERMTNDVSAFVFRDARAFLARHRKKCLQLLSFGDPLFQRKKIAGSGVKKCFSKIIITKGDKGNEIIAFRHARAVSRRKRVVFIDDSDVHIQEARRVPGVVIIQLRRRAAIHKSSVADYHVTTLTQASKIIESL